MKKNIDLGKTKFTKEEVAWISYFKQELELIRGLLLRENPKQEMEDEIILGYLSSFAYTIKLWVESKQQEKISSTIDKFACIITAYLSGKLSQQKGGEK